MRKVMLLVIVAFFLFSSVCYGAANNWGGSDRDQLLGKVVPSYLASVGSVVGGTSATIATPTTAVPVSYSLVSITLNSAAGQVFTLANGTAGQILTIVAGTKTSSDTAVITPTLCTGFTTITLVYAKQSVTLLYVNDTLGWILIGQGAISIASGAPTIA